ncbi:MAG TPA: glycosyltransferase [Edaphocola sp.]|nr:glycosyltransferase [Edaphocola sp.]
MIYRKINICFVLPDLNRGGAQRIMSYISQNLDKDRFKCTLLIINSSKETDFKIKNIEVKYLNKKRLLNASLSLLLHLKLRDYDIVIGSIGHINKILGIFSIFFRKTKFIGREASLDTIIQKYNKPKSSPINLMFNNYRKKLDGVICQSNDMMDHVIQDYQLNRENVFIINNPITIKPPIELLKRPTHDVKQFITIGRLSQEKGHSRILNVLSKLIDINWHYTIIGEGIENENIINQIIFLKLESQVTLVPHLDDVREALQSSDLFLQGSFVEGFPNALLESCLLGTPVVAFKAPGGTNEIINNNINGFIASNNDEYLNYIRIAIIEKSWNHKAISDSVLEKFNPKSIISKYENLFIKISNK